MIKNPYDDPSEYIILAESVDAIREAFEHVICQQHLLDSTRYRLDIKIRKIGYDDMVLETITYEDGQ